MNSEERRLLREKQWAEMWAEYAQEGFTPVDLWEGRAPACPRKNGFRGRLLVLPAREKNRGMVIICAGGGFAYKAAKEARPVARRLHEAGLNAAILDYTVDPTPDMTEEARMAVRRAACEDALRAIRYARLHAKEWGVPEDKIAIGGFSAGGVTSALAATMYDAGDPRATDALDRVSSRPDAALLLYGAFSFTASFAGRTGYDAALQRDMAALDPMRNLKPDSPPFFLFQTHGDDPRIALSFGMELASRGIPFEVHTFEEGPHGGALFNGKDDTPDIPHTARWADLAIEWLEARGF